MSGRRWHVIREEGAVTLARRLPARFDLSAETHLPDGHALRLAHQIRQDVWRALQDVRGFAPVVRLTRQGEGWLVTAGGSALPPLAEGLTRRIADVLEDPRNRYRWLRHARPSGVREGNP